MATNFSRKQLLNELNSLSDEIRHVSLTLFKIMIPALIIVKLLDELGAINLIGVLMGPLMQLVGLPESMGLVFRGNK